MDASGEMRSAPELTLSIANAHFVTPRLAFGGDLSPKFGLAKRQLQELAEAGITHIADLRHEWTDEPLVAVWQPKIRYLHHQVQDAGQRIPGAWFTELHDWVSRAWEDPGAKVLVHCHMGVNRAPSAAFGLLLAQGWSVKDALTALRTAREVAVIDYAQDALAWHLDRQGAAPRERGTARRSLTMWRQANRIDPEQVIRTIRSREHGGSTWLLVIDATTTDELAALHTGATCAVWLPVDAEPHDLAQLDEVLIWCADPEAGSPGLVGHGRVVGPTQERRGGRLWLPVLVRVFGRAGLLASAGWIHGSSDLDVVIEEIRAAAPTRGAIRPAPSSLLARLGRMR